MNEIEKEIEEMAKEIDDRMLEAKCYLGSMNRGEGYWIAQKLIEQGYKNCKDKVVLSKEELNTLIGNIEKSSEIKAEELKQARKETIKEIIDKVDDMIGGKLIAQALKEIYEVE